MCRTWGSNSGPLACQANTLPIELPRPGSLNVQKSLAKKLEAAKRNTVEYRHTGGGLTGQADAVTFELMKEALLTFFSNETHSFKSMITDSKDKVGNCVKKNNQGSISKSN